MEMVIHELAMNCEGAKFMNTNKAGQLKVNGINGLSKPKKAKVCVHQRVVDYHYNDNGKPTGNLVCRECGAVMPAPVNVFG
jgi:hypothetical protein